MSTYREQEHQRRMAQIAQIESDQWALLDGMQPVAVYARDFPYDIPCWNGEFIFVVPPFLASLLDNIASACSSYTGDGDIQLSFDSLDISAGRYIDLGWLTAPPSGEGWRRVDAFRLGARCTLMSMKF